LALFCGGLVSGLWVARAAWCGENAAPSSHLVFDDPFPGDIVMHDVRVPAGGESLHTYYEALGWQGPAAGYAGIQAHPKGHNYIFSIWDHPRHAAPIRAVHRGPGTLTEKFGGEGTGLKSWNFELGWEVGVWHTLALRCWPVDQQTQFGFWARSEKSGVWTHLMTMEVAVPEARIEGGTDAFIEDWLETGDRLRTTQLRNGWKRKLDGQWHPFGAARYSVNRWDLDPGKRSFNYRTNWDAGVGEDAPGSFYYMTAGGRNTRPTTTNPARLSIARTETAPAGAPLSIVSARRTWNEQGRLVVEWEIDPRTLPQFGHRLEARRSGDDAAAPPLAAVERIEPHARRAEIELPAGVDREQLTVSLVLRDLLDHRSPAFTVPAE